MVLSNSLAKAVSSKASHLRSKGNLSNRNKDSQRLSNVQNNDISRADSRTGKITASGFQTKEEAPTKRGSVDLGV